MTYDLELEPHHARMLETSAIARHVAQARGYRSVKKRAELVQLGFSPSQSRRVPALLVPIHGVTGAVVTYQVRPDAPRVKDGRTIKYETPAGAHLVLDVPPGAREALAKRDVELYITEGAKKADSAVSQDLCAVALLGVWSWRGTNEHGGKVALADFDAVALNDGRPVYIVFDSDVTAKREVQAALLRLKAFLERRGARVRVIYLQPGPNGAKTGLDDFFARRGTVAELRGLASSVVQESPRAMYEATASGLVWHRVDGNGLAKVPLTNFVVRIVADVVEDDDDDDTEPPRRYYELEVTQPVRSQKTIRVSAQDFPSMHWPGELLGAGFITYAGQSRRDHARVAILELSLPIRTRRIYVHTGWRRLGDSWAFLHAGGAIGASGAITDVDVVLPAALGRYQIPLPPTGAELVGAIRTALRFLDIAPARITFPLFAAVWRAVLGSADFSLQLTGDSGAGKTALLVLLVQFFGIDWNEENLPNWSSTGNALEGLAHQAKDVVLPIDDFAPSADPLEARRLQRDAERVYRAQGNTSGRMRMRHDTTLRPSRPPRGLTISTGEVVPRGTSLRARILVLHVVKETPDTPGDVDWAELTRAQQDAARGVYATTTAAFIRHVAPQYDDVRRRLRATVRERRGAVDSSSSIAHRRTPGIAANLSVGFETFLAFAVSVGALPQGEADAYAAAAQKAFLECARAQREEQAATDPVLRFLELVGAALAGGRAHVADGTTGGPPQNASLLGWRPVQVGSGDNERTESRPQGERIGWGSGDDVYLDEDLAYAAAQRLARDQGETLVLGAKTIAKRLAERKLLAGTEPGRSTIRRTLEARERRVLWFRGDSLLSQKPDEPDESDGAR